MIERPKAQFLNRQTQPHMATLILMVSISALAMNIFLPSLPRMADEFGDVMFALINYARFLDVNPDEALERTNRRFKARFEEMEHRIAVSGGDLASMPLEEMDRHWDAAKQALGQGKS